jgi:adenine-specific DNA-methyltransferase
MVEFIENKFNIHNILEPSAGDGRFIEALLSSNRHIHSIEIDKDKTKKLTDRNFLNTDVTCDDFIDYAINHNEKYSLIIGNPPYISKKNMIEKQRITSLNLLDYFELPHNLFQNLWVSFILASIKLLSYNGAIFFVLPFEFLQVQYAEKLRNFLETKFNTIKIITFEERIFKLIEQDICLVYLGNQINAKPYIQYTTIDNPVNANPIFQSVIMRNKPLKKWSNCILNDIETEILNMISHKYPKIREFGDISPGIVTGANDFFILNVDEAKKLNMYDYCLKIVSKSASISDKLMFSDEDYNHLLNTNKKVLLLDLNGILQSSFSDELNQYLDKGIISKINKRYKCSIRKRWYDVPIIKNGDVCFFKRYNSIPRIIINNAKVFTTDISYNIRFHNNIDKSSFVFSFYNSLTLVLCEYNGRFYGGGVGELVPSEFKDLHIPYCQVDQNHVDKLDEMFRNKTDIRSIIDYVDSIVLNLPEEQKTLLQDIRNRYIKRRLKR